MQQKMQQEIFNRIEDYRVWGRENRCKLEYYHRGELRKPQEICPQMSMFSFLSLTAVTCNEESYEPEATQILCSTADSFHCFLCFTIMKTTSCSHCQVTTDVVYSYSRAVCCEHKMIIAITQQRFLMSPLEHPGPEVMARE